MNVSIETDHGLIDALARCMAKADGKHIGASEWATTVGNEYRCLAQNRLINDALTSAMMVTLSKYRRGIRSGGL